MSHRRVKVYFLGSGAFASPVLESLCKAEGVELLGVGTQPDRPAGRKRAMTPTPLGKKAAELGMPCEKVQSVNSQDFLAKLASLGVEMLVVVSFGQLLKEPVLNFPSLGCLNVHASILPKLRGASPIASAILEGLARTGISFMKMDKGLDTGPVYRIVETEIGARELTAGLESRLVSMAAAEIGLIIEGIASGELAPSPQEGSLSSVSKKIRKCDGALLWTEPASLMERKVRAYQPWPGTFFLLNSGAGKTIVKVVEAEFVPFCGAAKPGEILQANGDAWTIACGEGALKLLKVLPEGRREMSSAEFLRGSQIKPGDMVLDGQMNNNKI